MASFVKINDRVSIQGSLAHTVDAATGVRRQPLFIRITIELWKCYDRPMYLCSFCSFENAYVSTGNPKGGDVWG